jgi:hypothetical protein
MKLIEPVTSVHEEFLVGFYYCKRQVDEQLKEKLEKLTADSLIDALDSYELEYYTAEQIVKLIRNYFNG